MSFEREDSVVLDGFPGSSCSRQSADSTVGRGRNTNSCAIGQKQQRPKTSVADGGPLYQALFMSDVAPKQKENDQDGENSLDGLGWPDNFMSVPSRSPRRNVAILQSQAPNFSSQSLSLSLTSPIASLSGSYGPISCDAADDKPSKEQDDFTDAYDKVDFDLNSRQQNTEFDLKPAKSLGAASRLSWTDIPSSSDLPSSNLDSLLDINSACYEAAVKEHYGKQKKTTSQYVSKMKKGKHHHHLSSQAYDKQLRTCQSPPPSTQSLTNTEHQQELVQRLKIELQKQQAQKEAIESGVTSHIFIESKTTSADNGSTRTKTTFATFTTPSMPPSSPPSSSTLSPSFSDEQKSPKSVKSDTDLKKHRYNQTALALQQSGLMKITIKTAELLRRSRTLQQELSKLRRETALFVQAVLSNPENKHLRDLAQQKNQQTA